MPWKPLTLMPALAAMLLMTACGADSGKAYDQPIDMVHQTLEKLEEPPMVFGREDVGFAIAENRPDKIVWTVGRGGMPRLRLEAALAADSATSTRVTMKVILAEHAQGPNQKPGVQSVGTVLALYKVAMEEQIDATLTHRDFNITALYPALAAAEAANIGTIGNQMDAAGEAYRKRDEDNIRKAYAAEASGSAR